MPPSQPSNPPPGPGNIQEADIFAKIERLAELQQTWTRLFAGRWRDPMVGRDLLVGMLLGSAAVCVIVGVNWIGDVARIPVPGPIATSGPPLTPPVPTSAALGMLTTA